MDLEIGFEIGTTRWSDREVEDDRRDTFRIEVTSTEESKAMARAVSNMASLVRSVRRQTTLC